jgi:uncharacterized protein
VLLEHGEDVKAQDKDNQTTLYWGQGEEVPQLLLDRGADANALDIKGWMPLHQASESVLVGPARVILEHGVDVNARYYSNNATPLYLASGPWNRHGGRRCTSAAPAWCRYEVMGVRRRS